MANTDPADAPLEGVEQYVAQLGAYATRPYTLRDSNGAPITDNAERMAKVVVLRDIAVERDAQDVKWGEQNRRDGTGGTRHRDEADQAQIVMNTITEMGIEPSWAILMKDLTASAYTQTSAVELRARVIKIAATAAAWAECIDRRIGVAAYCEKADAHRLAHVPVVPPAPHDVPGSE